MTENNVVPNRLSKETSPYLLQHQFNPVDWFPWGEEAFAKARQENKPLLISIGYSACHWCHVMEHESFSDPVTARLINESVVPVKVDREERPDVDAIYMNACTAMTGHGGWPLNAFVTPDLKPFFIGTYFPPEDSYGRPGFRTVLKKINEAWVTDHAGLRLQAAALHKQFESYSMVRSAETLAPDLLEDIVRDSHSTFDKRNGGFGTAPKFPPDTRLAALLAAYSVTSDTNALNMTTDTLEAMATRGLYDQIAGGFYRYSVDAQWTIPHFEKMLYNQALLIPVYADAWRVTDNAFYLQIACDTADWVIEHLTADDGKFQCAYDADSDGVEGKFYVWTPSQIRDILPDADAKLVCEYYGITDAGNFEHGNTNPVVVMQPAAFASKHGISEEDWSHRLQQYRRAMEEARAQRVWPGLDSKCLTGWNGLMISGLCNLAQASGEIRYQKAAARAANAVVENHWVDGILYRLAAQGDIQVRGTLEDYAFLCDALVDLYETTFEQCWLMAGNDIGEQMIKLFFDSNSSIFYYTDGTDTSLISRTVDSHDGALPASSSIAIRSLLRLGHMLGKERFTECARKSIKANGQKANAHPLAYASLVLANLYASDEVPSVVITAETLEAATPLLRVIHETYIPARNLVVKTAGQPDALPLAADKPVGPTPQVFICKNFTCLPPVQTPEELKQLLLTEKRL